MLDGMCIAAVFLGCIALGGEVVSIFAPEDRSIGGLCGVVVAAIICVLVLK